jgi:cyclohexanecarboxylate-CoA ligase
VPIAGRDLWELIDERVAATPDDEMLVDDGGQRVTFAEFRDRAERMAAGLVALGLGADDNVSWQLPTWIDSIVLAAALNRIGVVQNPILPIYREREVGFCVGQTGARFLIVPGVFRGFDFTQMAEGIAAETDDLEVLTVEPGSFPEGDPADLPPRPNLSDDPDALPVRWVCYTSGTTSDPKGARHTDASIAVIAEHMSERIGCAPGDRAILAFPFTHIGGITWLFAGLQFGVVNLTVDAFDPGPTVEFMRAEDCNIAGSGTPFHQAYLNAQRQNPDTPLLPNLKCCPGGGAPKPPQMHYDVKAEMGGVGIISGWGLTEAPILTMGAMTDSDEKLAETEGRPMPGVELRVVKLDGSLAGPGEEGELRAKAPQLMKGYLDSSLDADAFDDDGYFRTGDLGMQDTDSYVVITGRLKDVIIRHGENISAKEVEDLLYEHPAVADVAVIGLPDEVTGERACAVVSTAAGSEPLSFVQMQEYLRDKGLRSQAIPEQLEFVDVVPRNPSGKLMKQALSERYAAQPFSR